MNIKKILEDKINEYEKRICYIDQFLDDSHSCLSHEDEIEMAINEGMVEEMEKIKDWLNSILEKL